MKAQKKRPKFNKEKYSTVQFPRHFDVDQNNYIDYLEEQNKKMYEALKAINSIHGVGYRDKNLFLKHFAELLSDVVQPLIKEIES